MMELLAPAGGMAQLRAALRFGADAVYGALGEYGLRAYAGNFTPEQLQEGVRLAHAKGKKFYLTLNILPYDDDLPGLAACAQAAHDMGVDAAIVSDPGALSLLGERVPGLALHVSTQANVMNARTALCMRGLGARRVVLSREVSLARIARMRAALPGDLELEAFAHGAMCVAYSGRCLLSGALAGRGGNRGACAQPCRWQYAVTEARRPGEYLPVSQDARGTYLFSAYDLCMIEHLPEMARAGVASLKIEGRMKSEYYVATVVSAYRRALDALAQSEAAYRALLPALTEELQKASHRASNTGFYFGAPTPCAGAEGFSQTMEYTALCEGVRAGEALLCVKNRFYAGDTLEALTPRGPAPFPVSRITLEDTGEARDTVSVAGQRVRVPLTAPIEAGDLLRGPNRNHRPPHARRG